MVRAEPEKWKQYGAELAKRERALEKGEEVSAQPAATARHRVYYGQGVCRAASCSQSWRGVIRAEMVEHLGREPERNVRVELTDMPGTPRRVYECLYRPGEEAENRSKELERRFAMDGTSCQ